MHQIFFFPSKNFLLFFLFIKIPFIISQIHDNFEKRNLEEGNYDLLDVTDYHNLGLIVSSSKSIYTGIPPIKKVETDAALFKFSHLITINTNYLVYLYNSHQSEEYKASNNEIYNVKPTVMTTSYILREMLNVL